MCDKEAKILKNNIAKKIITLKAHKYLLQEFYIIEAIIAILYLLGW